MQEKVTHDASHAACDPHTLAKAAAIFQQLSNQTRLQTLLHLNETPATVSELCAMLNISQPLMSQHLRSLKQAALVSGTKNGKTVTYALQDAHVAHIVQDAIAHIAENHQPTTN